MNATNPGALNNRGVARYYQGKFELAVDDYSRAIELDPQFALAIKNRALALLALGKGEEAKRDYTMACSLGRCEDFARRCSNLNLRCKKVECTSIQTAIKAGLCPVK
jgi:tetratricopeptide (TPR) repeat protein